MYYRSYDLPDRWSARSVTEAVLRDENATAPPAAPKAAGDDHENCVSCDVYSC
jgi:hypothetical protein